MTMRRNHAVPKGHHVVKTEHHEVHHVTHHAPAHKKAAPKRPTRRTRYEY